MATPVNCCKNTIISGSEAKNQAIMEGLKVAGSKLKVAGSRFKVKVQVQVEAESP